MTEKTEWLASDFAVLNTGMTEDELRELPVTITLGAWVDLLNGIRRNHMVALPVDRHSVQP